MKKKKLKSIIAYERGHGQNIFQRSLRNIPVDLRRKQHEDMSFRCEAKYQIFSLMIIDYKTGNFKQSNYLRFYEPFSSAIKIV